MDVSALRLCSRRSNRRPPTLAGGACGSPTKGKARTVPTASGLTVCNSVLGTYLTPKRLLPFAFSSARRLGSILESSCLSIGKPKGRWNFAWLTAAEVANAASAAAAR